MNVIQISPDYWENVIAYLVAYAILALIIERALYQIFDTKLWAHIEKKMDEQTGTDIFDLKPWISIAISLVIVFRLKLDMIATVLDLKEAQTITMIITSLFIAGGSTAVYKLFRNLRKLKELEIEIKAKEV